MSSLVTNLIERMNEGLNIALKSDIGVFLGRVVLRLQSNLPAVHPAVKVAVVAGAVIGSLVYIISTRREITRVKAENLVFSISNQNQVKEIEGLKTKIQNQPLPIDDQEVKGLHKTNLDLANKLALQEDLAKTNKTTIDEKNSKIKQLTLANESINDRNNSLKKQNGIAVVALQKSAATIQSLQNEINTLKSQLEAAKEREITS